MKKQLLIGCGSNWKKRLTDDMNPDWEDMTTLDYNSDHNPDVVWDLTSISGLPFDSDTFDEIHAYEVLEHTGSQGDYRFFFWQFSDFWRVLKPDGCLFVTCPSRHSAWAWGDPSHTRILQKEQLVFLDQEQYEIQVGKTSMSDFRNIYRADFKTKWVHEDENSLMFILSAVKPSRLG